MTDGAAFDPARHWAWFAGILSGLAMAGVVIAVLAMLPLAMATDPCHGDDHDGVCALTATGQNVLVWIPWVAVGAGTLSAIIGAVVAARYRHSPLIGLLLGVLAYAVAIPIVYRIAFLV